MFVFMFMFTIYIYIHRERDQICKHVPNISLYILYIYIHMSMNMNANMHANTHANMNPLTHMIIPTLHNPCGLHPSCKHDQDQMTCSELSASPHTSRMMFRAGP